MLINIDCSIRVYSFVNVRVPYIGNRLRKKMFADFVNLGAFATIFLALFDVMKILNRNTKFVNIFLRMLKQSTCRKSFLSRMIPYINRLFY